MTKQYQEMKAWFETTRLYYLINQLDISKTAKRQYIRRYIKNCIDCDGGRVMSTSIDDRYRVMLGGFFWDHTPEGTEYWDDLDNMTREKEATL